MEAMQFYGWSRDHDWLHVNKSPRKDTWLSKRIQDLKRKECSKTEKPAQLAWSVRKHMK